MGRKNLNLANILVLVGMGWLGFSFWLPYGTADRVFRIEKRTAKIAQRFADTVAARGKIQWKDHAIRGEILAAVNKKCGYTIPASSLYLRVATPPRHLRDHCFLFEGKHYLYLVTNTPASVIGRNKTLIGPAENEQPKEDPMDAPPPTEFSAASRMPLPIDDALPFETYAWPKSRFVGTHTVFFIPSDGAAAFTRNLNDRYVGARRVPQPGDGRFDIDTDKRENAYRGRDDERWIYQDPKRPPG